MTKRSSCGTNSSRAVSALYKSFHDEQVQKRSTKYFHSYFTLILYKNKLVLIKSNVIRKRNQAETLETVTERGQKKA